MRASRAIGLYVVAVILLGALLAPWLFWAVQELGPQASVFGTFAKYPFHRMFDRSIMLVALIGLWPLLRAIGFRFWSDLGYVRARNWWRQALAGWVLGVASLALIVIVTVAMGSRHMKFDRSTQQIAAAVVRYLLTGVAVAVLEETFFRGALQGALQRRMNAALAIVLASLVYSALHFLKPNLVNIPADHVSWSSGLACLVGSVTQPFGSQDAIIGFVTLILVGCVLGLTYARTGALYLPIGLHAGWVLANEFARWLGGGSVIEYVACLPMLVVLLVIMARLCRTTFKPLHGPEPSTSGRGAL